MVSELDPLGSSPMDEIDFAENKEQRCPVLLLCDTSGSMVGEPIRELNAAIRQFRGEVNDDDIASLRVEMAVVTFDIRVTMQHPFARMEHFDPPTLQAGGPTDMAQAIQAAIQMLDLRKETYREEGIPYFRPILVLMTDGMSTSPEYESRNARILMAQQENEKRLICFKVGVGPDGVAALRELLDPGQYPPLEMDNAKYSEFFKWLSTSVQNISRSSPSETISLPSTDSWRVIEP